MPVLNLIKTTSTSNLIDYAGWAVSEVSVDGETIADVHSRAVYEAGQNCRPATSKLEFRDLREEHGQQNAMYKVPARYEAAAADEATHIDIRAGRRGKGKDWRLAKPGEQATHQRVRYLEGVDGEQATHVQVRDKRHGSPKYRAAEPGERATHWRAVDQGDGRFPDQWQRRHEGQHWIMSFGLHEVNPDDPEGCEKAFDSVVALWEQDRGGMQAHFIAHGDAHGSQQACAEGESGKFHVHIAENAVVHSKMQVPGRAGQRTRAFRPGMRAAGPLTDVELVRERSDRFLKERGHEFGLGEQVLPSRFSAEARAVKRTDHDFYTRERGIIDGTGEVSHQDEARDAVEKSLLALNEDPAAVGRLSASDRLEALAERVEHESEGRVSFKLRRTKDGEAKLRSIVVEGRKQAMTKSQLGERYSDDGLQQQLSQIAAGRYEPLAKPRAGEPKAVEALGKKKVARLQREADDLAAPHSISRDWDAAHAMNAHFDAQKQAAAEAAAAQLKAQEDQRKKDEQRAQEEAAAAVQAKADAEYAELEARIQANPDAELAAKAVWVTERYGYGSDAFTLRDVDVFKTMDRHSLTYEQAVTARLSAIEIERRAKGAAEAQKEPQGQQPSKDARRTSGLRQEHKDTSQPDAGPSSSQQDEGTSTKPQPPAAKPPHQARQIGAPVSEAQMKNRELVAIVRSERADGGAYVDFQLAAEDPTAAGQPGLSLRALDRERPDGVIITQTWQPLQARDYAKLKAAGAGNETTVMGSDGKACTVYRIRADIAQDRGSKPGHRAYSPKPNSMDRSSIQANPDVMVRQQAHENSNRTEEHEQQRQELARQGLENTAAKVSRSVAELTTEEGEPPVELPAHERAFARAQERQGRSGGRGR